MGQLIDQLCATIHEWSRRTGYSEMVVLVRAMTDTGGIWHCPPIGKVDPAHLPPGQLHDLAPGDSVGYYSVKQLKSWLETLVQSVGLREDFLVVAIVRSIEAELAARARDGESVGDWRQPYRADLDALASDQWRQDLLQQLNRPAKANGLPERSEPLTEADLGAIRAIWEAQGRSMRETPRSRRAALTIWGEETAAVLASAKHRLD